MKIKEKTYHAFVLCLVLIFLSACSAYDSDRKGSPSESLKSPVVKTNIVDGAKIVLIPGGKYTIFNQGGLKKVNVEPFHIYRYEVTNRQFDRFVKKTGYKPQGEWRLFFNASTADHPVCEVSYADAAAYAKWAGGALPTRAQWEIAAHGGKPVEYPWGNEWTPDHCNGHGMKTLRGKVAKLEKHDGIWYGTLPVGSFPAGASPFGVMDMSGNVAEWCSGWYEEGARKERLLMGGSFFDKKDRLKISASDGDDPEKWCNLYGFRVALPVKDIRQP